MDISSWRNTQFFTKQSNLLSELTDSFIQRSKHKTKPPTRVPISYHKTDWFIFYFQFFGGSFRESFGRFFNLFSGPFSDNIPDKCSGENRRTSL